MNVMLCCVIAVLLGLGAWKWWRLRRHFAALYAMEEIPVNLWLGLTMFLYNTADTFSTYMVATAKVHRHLALFWPVPFVPYLVINAAEEAEELLKSSNLTKSREYDHMRGWLGIGLVLSKGELYRRHRRLLTPTFHFASLTAYAEIFAAHADELCQRLRSRLDTPIDVQTEVDQATLGSICDCILGRQLGQSEGYSRAIEDLTRAIRRRMQMPWLWPQALFKRSALGKEEERCLTTIHAASTGALKRTLEEEDEGNGADSAAFIHALVALLRSGSLSFAEVRQHLDNFLFGGHDTTTISLVWALFLLAHHPDVQKKVQAELDEQTGEEMFTPQGVKELEYLDRVLKEVLRLYPPIPIMGRVVEETLRLGEVEVPTGTTVSVSLFSLHRDPRHWPDPLRFEPDRFLPEAVAERHPFAYLPFSAGVRNCIGQKFAMLEAKIVLAKILKSFRVEPVTSMFEVQPLVELMLRPDKEIQLRFLSR